MQFINYQIHLLLYSKYKSFVIILLYFLVYILLINTKISYCMMEEPGSPLSDSDAILEVEGENEPATVREYVNYPDVAEAKEGLANQSPIIKEIESYADSQTQLLRRIYDQAERINDQAEVIARHEKRIEELLENKARLHRELFDAQSKAAKQISRKIWFFRR